MLYAPCSKTGKLQMFYLPCQRFLICQCTLIQTVDWNIDDWQRKASLILGFIFPERGHCRVYCNDASSTLFEIHYSNDGGFAFAFNFFKVNDKDSP